MFQSNHLIGFGVGESATLSPATFVLASTKADGAGGVFDITGFANGDIAFVFAENNTAPTLTEGTGGTWTNLLSYTGSGSFAVKLWYKVLLTGDTGPTIGNITYGSANLSIYRGASACIDRTAGNTGGTGTSLAFTGFTKDAASAGVLSWCASYAKTGTVPTSFTSRATVTATYFKTQTADLLTGYVDGASVTWTSVGTNTFGALVELTV